MVWSLNSFELAEVFIKSAALLTIGVAAGAFS